MFEPNLRQDLIRQELYEKDPINTELVFHRQKLDDAWLETLFAEHDIHHMTEHFYDSEPDYDDEEFGMYTLYAYTSSDAAVVMNVRGKMLVIRAQDETVTREIFETLQTKLDAIAPVD